VQPEFADTMDESRKRDVPTANAKSISSPLGMSSHELSVHYHLRSLYGCTLFMLCMDVKITVLLK